MTKKRGNKEGGLYRRADSMWCASFTVGYDQDGHRKRRVVYGKTKTEVQKKLLELQSASAAGILNDPKRIKLGEYLKHWLEDSVKPSVRLSSYIRYESLVRFHILPHLGGIQIAALRPSHIQNLYRRLQDNNHSARTRELVHITLQKALNQALKWSYIQVNPCTMVTNPKYTKKATRCWDEKQATLFLNSVADNRQFALYVLALTTGLRLGELFGLQWTDIDFSGKALFIQRTVNELGGKIVIGEPKTAKGRRRVELPELALTALRTHSTNRSPKGAMAPWVFCDSEGGPLRGNNFRNHNFYPLLEKSGLPPIRFHDLRHTAATLLLSQGVHPKVVQERLGHSQITVTLDIYSHVLPSMQKDAASKIDQICIGVLK